MIAESMSYEQKLIVKFDLYIKKLLLFLITRIKKNRQLKNKAVLY